MAKKMAVRNKEKKEPRESFWKRNKNKAEVAKGDENNPSRSRGIKIAVRVFGAVCGIFMLGFVAKQLILFWSNTWPVKSVLIMGDAAHVSKAEISEIMISEDMRGMLSIDLVELHKKLLIHPWIKSAIIRKQWPETLSFELEEFNAIANINDKLLLDSGVSVNNKNVGTTSNLLRMVIAKSRIEKGRNLLELVDKIESMKIELALLHLELKTFEIDETNNWFIYISERFKINLGRQQQQQRMERFFTVFAAIENKQQLEHIDLRYRNGLSVKYKQNLSSSKKQS
ncbi:MAG: FtsQ-type POTRA domain-containing protein [Kangiellaceae bacterium]|nr:FtsQ-type POTRA domain-containing protein [Kangiellaceae bacterium]